MNFQDKATWARGLSGSILGVFLSTLVGCDESSSDPTGDAQTPDSDANVSPDGLLPTNSAFDCEAVEDIESNTVHRDAVLTLDGRTLRFPTLPSCLRRTMGADIKYTEVANAVWVDQARIGQEYALGSGYLLANITTGPSELTPGTFQVRPQPTTAEGFSELGIYGMLGIKDDPVNSAQATPWALSSGAVQVIEHDSEGGDRRCIELKLQNVVVARESDGATRPVSGSIGCLLP